LWGKGQEESGYRIGKGLVPRAYNPKRELFPLTRSKSGRKKGPDLQGAVLGKGKGLTPQLSQQASRDERGHEIRTSITLLEQEGETTLNK